MAKEKEAPEVTAETAAAPEAAEAPKVETAQERLKRLQAETKELKEKIKAEKAAKKTKEPAYTRIHSIVDIIKVTPEGGLSKDEIGVRANSEYVAHGGKDNITESKSYTDKTLKTLALIPGLVNVSAEGKYTFNLPAVPAQAVEEAPAAAPPAPEEEAAAS